MVEVEWDCLCEHEQEFCIEVAQVSLEVMVL